MSATSLLAAVASNPKPAVIDDEHLGRMTLGDRSLEHEILAIFARQITLILNRIAGAEAEQMAAAAHTLLGSARGIGAWRVASAAERLESVASGAAAKADIDAALEELKAAGVEAGAAICARLGQSLVEVSRSH